jgi:hypothetical protein
MRNNQKNYQLYPLAAKQMCRIERLSIRVTALVCLHNGPLSRPPYAALKHKDNRHRYNRNNSTQNALLQSAKWPVLLFLGFYFASDDQGLFVFGILCWCCIQLLQNKTWKEDRFKP